MLFVACVEQMHFTFRAVVPSVLVTRRAVHILHTGCFKSANEPDVFIKCMEIIY